MVESLFPMCELDAPQSKARFVPAKLLKPTRWLFPCVDGAAQKKNANGVGTLAHVLWGVTWVTGMAWRVLPNILLVLRGKAKVILWRNPFRTAPTRKPWNDDFPVNTNNGFQVLQESVHPPYAGFRGLQHQIFHHQTPGPCPLRYTPEIFSIGTWSFRSAKSLNTSAVLRTFIRVAHFLRSWYPFVVDGEKRGTPIGKPQF